MNREEQRMLENLASMVMRSEKSDENKAKMIAFLREVSVSRGCGYIKTPRPSGET